jgi:hypothetical protein
MAAAAVCDTWNFAPGHDSFESSIQGWLGLAVSGGSGVATKWMTEERQTEI